LHKTTAHIVFIPMTWKIFSGVMSANDRVLYSHLYINEHPSPAYLQSSIEHFFAVNSADCRNGIRIQDNILFGVLGSHHSRYDFVDSNSSFTVE
jgi:hypothetical protein